MARQLAVPAPRAVGMNLSAIIGISVTLPQLHDISQKLKRRLAAGECRCRGDI
jgi:hypothetical protein